MKASNRLIVNTFAQYTRTFFNVILSLYSARLVLSILGESDFGLYSLVGGVVALLSFLTNSLVSATQRFLSVSHGEGNNQKIKEIFNNSLIIHLLLGSLVVVILVALTPVFFNGFLDVQSGREHAAIELYHQVVAMMFISFVASPYRAALISRENIIFISVIDILDGVLKLVLVLLLPYATTDKLVLYGWIMLSIRFFNFLAFSVYGYLKYEECGLPQITGFRWNYFKQLMAFTGWVLYSSFCIVGRNQGFSIVLNKMIGTVANAAYGIGNQISGYVSFISSSFATAIAPQLMKASGGKDYGHMMDLAKFQSKISFLLLSMISIPIMFEMQQILKFWLINVPEFTSLFAIMVLLGILVDQPTQGLGTIIHSFGKMRTYSIVTYTPKFLLLPFSWLCLHYELPMWTTAASYVSIEIICMLLRIPILKRLMNYSIRDYISFVFVKTIIPILASVVICLVIKTFFDFRGRFVFTILISVLVFIIVAYNTSLSEVERNKVKEIILRVVKTNSFLFTLHNPTGHEKEEQ